MEKQRKIFIVFFLLIGLAINFILCSKHEELAQDSGTGVKAINSTQSGTVSLPSGFSLEVIAGTVPPNQSNNPATVTFSIEAPVDPPSALPAGYTLKGDIVKFGPDGFTFSWPVRIWLPGSTVTDLSNAHIIHYNAESSEWEIIPISSLDSTNKLIGADVITLGYYAVVSTSFTFAKPSGEQSEGGFKYTGESGYHHSLTVKSVQFKYASQASWYTNIVGASASSGSDPTGSFPNTWVKFHLPQGTYSIWVSKTKPGTLSEIPKIYTYSIPATGSIAYPLEYWGWGSITEASWTTLTLPGGGEWKEGRPSEWGSATSTYGTGDFQATLTWTNTDQSSADLDMYLYGPNSMIVYYGNKTSSDTCYQLDRDWRYTTGNAVENIYSLKSVLPKGQYKLTVDHYGGSVPKSFNVRVIRSHSVKSYYQTISTANQEITIYEFTLE